VLNAGGAIINGFQVLVGPPGEQRRQVEKTVETVETSPNFRYHLAKERC
jgi:hypothetical protein